MRAGPGVAGAAGATVVASCLVAALTLTVLAALAAPVAGQEPPVEPPPVRAGGNAPVLLILDASGSMRADDGTGRTKIEAAKEALTRLVGELPDGVPVGLRVYGHRVPNTDKAAGCQDTELVQPVAPLDRQALKGAIASFEAKGFTPIGASLEAALSDLPAEGPRTVVLVSDGIDTCAPPDPCAVATQLAADDVELRVETVGFQVDPAAQAQLSCIADVTGGRFRTADDADSLLRALLEYQVTGSPVSGGATPAEAPTLVSGQYRDTIEVGQQRWYAVELEEGQALRTTATVVGERGGPVAPNATITMEAVGDDVLGSVSCGRDEVTRVGQEARQVNVDGLDTSAQGICQDPGRYLVRLELEDGSPQASVLAGQALDVELLVSIVDAVAAGVAPSPQASPVAALSTGEADERPGPGAGAYLAAGLVAGVLGVLVGAGAARRLGP